MNPVLLPLCGVIASAAFLAILAPDYLRAQGFPLDDAWIHAVYARAIAFTGTLSYNPGVPTTGETAPLWALACAPSHWLASTDGGAVVLTKLTGLVLHAASAVVIYAALGSTSPLLRGTGALFVGAHPDLLSAAVSGMEVPLATLLGAAMLYAARTRRVAVYAALSALAPLARPELGVFAVSFPMLLYSRRAQGMRWKLLAAAMGSGLSLAAFAVRNMVIAGRPLPTTFYAKVGSGDLTPLAAQLTGYSEVLGQFAISDSSLLLAASLFSGFWVLGSGDSRSAPYIAAAAAFVAGLIFCSVSFALVPPIDPLAFYHQRYALPALPFIIAPIPLLADAALRQWLRSELRLPAQAILIGLAIASVVLESLNRYPRLANDARNIDDVQVAIGRAMADRAPDDVVWTVDAGAIRFFGRPLAVDLMGLNTPQVLGPDAESYLNAHRPRYVVLVPEWATVDDATASGLKGEPFTTSTRYTVTTFVDMQTQWLVECPPGRRSGSLRVRDRQDKLHSYQLNCSN